MSKPQPHIKSLVKSQALYHCFTQAINNPDLLSQRQAISQCLRLSAIAGLDGLEILWQALNQHFRNIPPNPPPITKQTTQQPYTCPNPGCGKTFSSAKGLYGHGPNKNCKHRKP